MRVFFLAADTCTQCEGRPIFQMHLDMLHQLIPELKKSLNESSIWWSVKPDSPLNTYIPHFFATKEYFLLDDLVKAIADKAYCNQSTEPGNPSLLIADKILFSCFNKPLIIIEELYELCLNHIYVANKSETFRLQQNYVHNTLLVPFHDSIVYNDPSSRFWLHPDVNYFMTGNRQIIYTWEELKETFQQFLGNKEHFIRFDETKYELNNSSPLCDIFKFKHFDQTQIENILVKLTKYLGKCQSLATGCRYISFNFNLVNRESFAFLNYLIQCQSDQLCNWNYNITL